jgi:site-specific recombinase XerD
MMETKPKFTPNRDLKRMDQARQVLRYHHYARNTEKTYCKWIPRYIRYFGAHRHPSEMGAKEVETFLSHLATTDKVSAATQHQALAGIYTHVMQKNLAAAASPLDTLRNHGPDRKRL